MIKTSGGPLPTTRYPMAPSLVCAIRTGADTTEAVPGAIPGAEPHALSAKDTTTATRPKAIPCRNAGQPQAARVRAVTFVAVSPGIASATVDR
jgi:hypothetical protein